MNPTRTRQAANAARPGASPLGRHPATTPTPEALQAARIRARRGRLLRLLALGCILSSLALPLAGASSSFSAPLWCTGCALLCIALAGSYPRPT